MSEFEFFEAFALATQATGLNFTALSTGLLAYVTAGHLVAKKLPKKVAIGATLAYSVFMFGPLVAYAGWFNTGYELTQQYFELYPDGRMLQEIPSYILHISVFTVPVLVLYLSSIYYVHFYIRGSQSRDDDT